MPPSKNHSDLGINRFSPSGMMMYESCPKAFYYQVWLGLKLPQPQKHFAFGHAVHNAIGNIYDQKDKETNWEHAERKLAVNTFKSQFKIDAFDINELNWKGEKVYESEHDMQVDYDDMLLDGVKIIESYWDEKEALLAQYGIDLVQLEIPYKGAMKNLVTGIDFEIPLSCRLDALNKDESIVELKTSGQKYDVEEKRKSAQALTYVWVKYQQTGRLMPLTYIVMLKGRKKDRIQVIRYDYKLADLEMFMHRVQAFIDGVKNREFDRGVMNHPMWCECRKFDRELDYVIKTR